jgi:8-oxo-dGTP pyrophosphatase MutT (NUDIX family)
MHEPWIVLDEEVAYENRWVRVRLQRLQLPRGEAYDYTVVDRPAQGVAVALLDDSGDILMEREYRHGIGQVVWQIPGGLVDESESALTSAQRELREETGYEAREWVELAACRGTYSPPHYQRFVALGRRYLPHFAEILCPN